uniref:Uncharacterized protein n=1 Tax=Euplotes harpa TaxID=151035 RepID=A0A7S3JAB0_9SPIT|mmetsp:Transcript_23887/g.27508  ORF Transcript_23887/g.27508 Transcript_23887/m.27508 type:complete len:155 (+) Transcript_23887:192-656(+)
MDSYILEKSPTIDTYRDTLLNTIRIPQNGKMKQISGLLPHSNYGDMSVQLTRKSQLDKELHFNTVGKNSVSLDQESKIADCTIITKGKYLAIGGKMSNSETRNKSRDIDGKQFSYRNYIGEINAYSGHEVRNSVVNISREKSHRRAESSLLKLK